MNNLTEETDDGEDGGNAGSGAATDLKPLFGPLRSKRRQKTHESSAKSEYSPNADLDETPSPDTIFDTKVEIEGVIFTIRMVNGEYHVYDENMEPVGKSRSLKGAYDAAANHAYQTRLGP